MDSVVFPLMGAVANIWEMSTFLKPLGVWPFNFYIIFWDMISSGIICPRD